MPPAFRPAQKAGILRMQVTVEVYGMLEEGKKCLAQRQEVLLEPVFETERDATGGLVYVRHPLSDAARKLFWRRGVVVR